MNQIKISFTPLDLGKLSYRQLPTIVRLLLGKSS